jgi:hypothetical protein
LLLTALAGRRLRPVSRRSGLPGGEDGGERREEVPYGDQETALFAHHDLPFEQGVHVVVVAPLARLLEGEAPLLAGFDGLLRIEARVPVVHRMVVGGRPVAFDVGVLEDDLLACLDL